MQHGSLTLHKLDYRIEYAPENNGNDSRRKFLRGEFIVNDKTQGRK